MSAIGRRSILTLSLRTQSLRFTRPSPLERALRNLLPRTSGASLHSWRIRSATDSALFSSSGEAMTRSPASTRRQHRTMSSRLLVLVGSLFLAAEAFAAPDEAALGQAEGYPICPPSLRPDTRCLVGLVSHFDEIFPARIVARGAKERPLKRAAAEPAIRYRYQSQDSGLDDYLSRHRTTGLLILKGDTILAKRYQYDRKPEHRMASYSMAKTIVAMLVGIALAEGKVQSLDDRAEKYVAELKGTA